ncbi:MAG: metallophosphoesterase, partial [Magnetococcales bacterium]|nr:metallophosphoesterase [Magnetococcales bacterium]
MSEKTIRWLHLSDMHMGCPGKTDRDHMLQVFSGHVSRFATQRGVPDLILITGDIAWSGTEEQYREFDAFLLKLNQWLGVEAGLPGPVVVPVPGNHDLVWPSEAKLKRAFSILVDIAAGQRAENLTELEENLHDETNKGMFAELFKAYHAWLKRLIATNWNRPGELRHAQGEMPGDVCLHLNLPGRPSLAIVGLNSAWMQIAKGDYEKKLEMLPRQFLRLAGQDGALPLHEPALLLMHHPPEWLSEPGRAG